MTSNSLKTTFYVAFLILLFVETSAEVALTGANGYTSSVDGLRQFSTLVIGDGNDADGFCVLADAELQAADTEGTGWAAGWQEKACLPLIIFGMGLGHSIYSM